MAVAFRSFLRFSTRREIVAAMLLAPTSSACVPMLVLLLIAACRAPSIEDAVFLRRDGLVRSECRTFPQRRRGIFTHHSSGGGTVLDLVKMQTAEGTSLDNCRFVTEHRERASESLPQN